MKNSHWTRLKEHFFFDRETQFSLDVSFMNFEPQFLERMEPQMMIALEKMAELEGGAIANPDENRMVGHYWLRAPERSPTPEIRAAIEETIQRVERFSEDLQNGWLVNGNGDNFESFIVVGIGGSALGPQFVADALGSPSDKLKPYFFDNTDPDGFARVLESLPNLDRTLGIVISKSGGTKETRNGQLILKETFLSAGLKLGKHMIAITGEGSELDKTAQAENWLMRFPMWDWVGGRTSELSAVGLIPAALQGFSIRKMLEGAKSMDELTRRSSIKENPAALLALMWYHAGCGKGSKDMVILPYKDRLLLLSRYLQQLVMESLGKEKNIAGERVFQGLSVYGNKGSTDQHAYVQQLREGIPNFFAVFVEVLQDAFWKQDARLRVDPYRFQVEPGITSGDYLAGFLQGTREALFETGRESVTISVSDVSPFSVGQLIALFERTVGLYAHLVNINAYHQPGVEAGKKAAATVLDCQRKIVKFLESQSGFVDLEAVAAAIGGGDEKVRAFSILRRFAANGRVVVEVGSTPFEDRYRLNS
jgi:glucose-6-phosphate isomerase